MTHQKRFQWQSTKGMNKRQKSNKNILSWYFDDSGKERSLSCWLKMYHMFCLLWKPFHINIIIIVNFILTTSPRMYALFCLYSYLSSTVPVNRIWAPKSICRLFHMSYVSADHISRHAFEKTCKWTVFLAIRLGNTESALKWPRCTVHSHRVYWPNIGLMTSFLIVFLSNISLTASFCIPLPSLFLSLSLSRPITQIYATSISCLFFTSLLHLFLSPSLSLCW